LPNTLHVQYIKPTSQLGHSVSIHQFLEIDHFRT